MVVVSVKQPAGPEPFSERAIAMVNPPGPGLDVQFDRSGHHLTVYLAGQLDLVGGPDLASQVIKRADRSVEEVWLDLSALSYCDSAGLAAFLAIDEHVAGQDALTVLYQPRGAASTVLSVSGIDHQVRVIGRRKSDALTPALNRASTV